MLPEANLPWFAGVYFKNPADARKPMASPIHSENLKGLPPATIINAQRDVLADDGAAYTEKLEAAGVPVIHEVQGRHAQVLRHGLAMAAEKFAGEQLKKAFGSAEAEKEG